MEATLEVIFRRFDAERVWIGDTVCLAEIALLRDTKRTASVRATRSAELYLLCTEHFLAVMK